MIFIDGFGEKAFNVYKKYPFLSGITTNPTILRKNGYCFKKAVEILSNTKGFHFIQGSVKNTRWLEFIKKYPTEKFVIKLPWVPSISERIADSVKKEGFRICATAVYTEAQGLSAVEYGVDYIAIYYDRMKRNKMNPRNLIEFLTFMNANVLIASLKNMNQIIDAIKAGSRAFTAPPDVIEEFFKVKFPENDFEKFEGDFCE